MAEQMKTGDVFTVKKDAGRIELPDGGWMEPGHAYRVTYDKLEFANKLVASGKAEVGDTSAAAFRPGDGISPEQMRKYKKEAQPVDENEANQDDTVHPDLPREARNDQKRREREANRAAAPRDPVPAPRASTAAAAKRPADKK